MRRVLLVAASLLTALSLWAAPTAHANDPSLTFEAHTTCVYVSPGGYHAQDWGAVRRGIDPNRWEITNCRFSPDVSPNYGPLCEGIWGNAATGEVVSTGFAAYDPQHPAPSCPPIEGGSSF